MKLDPAMRSLGDTYARKEFRLHAKPQVQEAHKQMFLREWRAYVDMVSAQATVTGQELTDEQKSKLNDQQKVQLDSLEKSAKALGGRSACGTAHDSVEPIGRRSHSSSAGRS